MFSKRSKKSPITRKYYSSNIDFFGTMDKKYFFLNYLKHTYFYSKCWHFRSYEQNRIFSKWSKVPFSWISIFSQIWTKKPLFRSEFKITSFSLKCWYFRIYGQIRLLQIDLKKSTFSFNIDLFRAGNDFIKVISK